MIEESERLPNNVKRPYTGGHSVIYGGYYWELCPFHKKANPFGFVPRHRLVIERYLGRYLRSDEVVHHKNGNKLDDTLSNLQVMTRAQHLALHQELRRVQKLGKPAIQEVSELLNQGGIKYAAKQLGMCVETLRKHYPELTKPYVRRSPTNIDDPEVIKKVLGLAIDDRYGYREIAALTGVSARTCGRICQRHGVKWVRKSKVGEIHTTYDKRTAQEIIDEEPENAQKIVQYCLDDNVSLQQVYQELGVNYVYIQKILDYYNLQWIVKNPHN